MEDTNLTELDNSKHTLRYFGSNDNRIVPEDVILSKRAANGDIDARKAINRRVHSIIVAMSKKFCKNHCHGSRFTFRCTIDSRWGNINSDALLCEWGNASYAWMLNDLARSERLLTYKGIDGATLESYWNSIAASRPFLERWREWRYGYRLKIPDYIASIDTIAAKVFTRLRENDTIANIAQRLGVTEDHVDRVRDRIIIELTKRNRLNALNPTTFFSLQEFDDESNEIDEFLFENDLTTHPEIDRDDDIEKLQRGLETLSPEERFVIEAMKVEELDAQAVLHALIDHNFSVKKGVQPEQTNVQQLYYFLRKSLAKLARNSGLLKQ